MGQRLTTQHRVEKSIWSSAMSVDQVNMIKACVQVWTLRLAFIAESLRGFTCKVLKWVNACCNWCIHGHTRIRWQSRPIITIELSEKQSACFEDWTASKHSAAHDLLHRTCHHLSTLPLKTCGQRWPSYWSAKEPTWEQQTRYGIVKPIVFSYQILILWGLNDCLQLSVMGLILVWWLWLPPRPYMIITMYKRHTYENCMWWWQLHTVKYWLLCSFTHSFASLANPIHANIQFS